MRAPWPLQVEQRSTPRSRSMTLRVRRSERDAPLYSCSSVTLSGCTMGSPFLTRLRSPRRPRPDSTSKMSVGPSPAPFSKPSSP
eukprot:scaffold159755_cov32-Tisochrysis_lutea.AAC.5